MSTTPTYDLLIRGGTVIDGTKAPRFDADVAVLDGRIAAVGDLAGASAARTIDAEGLIVAPGFIDSHTHDDQALLSQPGHGLQGLAGRDDGDRRQLRHQRRAAGARHEAADAARPDRRPALRAPRDLRLVGGGAGGRAGRDQRRRRWSATRRCAPRRWTTSTARRRRRRSRGCRRSSSRRSTPGAIGLSTGTFYPPALKASTAEIIEVGRPLSARAGPLRHPHARRGVEGDGGARRDLPHRPRARHSRWSSRITRCRTGRTGAARTRRCRSSARRCRSRRSASTAIPTPPARP